MDRSQPNAAAAGTFVLGDLTVNRLGFGAMRITGPRVLGDPSDREQAKAVLRRAVDLGVTLIDTADSYGPGVSEELIAEALRPYPEGVVIATKGGFLRRGGGWIPNGRPAHPRVALAWLLRRSPAILPIPGTSSAAHLEENVGAAHLRLSDEEFEALAA